MTSDLPAYLDAQLAAIEDTARAATGGRWATYAAPRKTFIEALQPDDEFLVIVQMAPYGTDRDAAHIALHDPTFTLAWCAAIRAVVAMHSEPGGHECVMGLGQRGLAGWYDREDPCCPTLRALAQPFAGGEGWQEGWAL